MSITSVSHSPSLNQQVFATKAQHTVLAVITDLITVLTHSSSMKWPDFKATHIDPKQQQLSALDQRTNDFFRKMMNAIYPAVDAIPTLKNSFQIFGMASQDPDIGTKLVEGIALPHVKAMMAELDAIQASIVDDVNAS